MTKFAILTSWLAPVTVWINSTQSKSLFLFLFGQLCSFIFILESAFETN